MSICMADALIRCVRGWEDRGRTTCEDALYYGLATEETPFHNLTPLDCLVNQMFAETGAHRIYSGAKKVCWKIAGEGRACILTR